MSRDAILALDEGTTGTRGMVFDRDGVVLGAAAHEVRQIYPRAGAVEHDPEELFRSTVRVGQQALHEAGLEAGELCAIGITNQRETTLVWERDTGQPIHNAIVWQSRVSSDICARLAAEGYAELVRERTGLLIDPYFSGTKIRWLLDRVDGAQRRAEAGELLFGTVESWLVWRLTHGRVHCTDVANASRTLLFNIATLDWDDELLRMLDVPRPMLPNIVRSAGVIGEADADILGSSVPIAGLAGDQQAALFGQACFTPGQAKNTYGTGCFLLATTGTTPQRSAAGLLTTVAWDIGEGATYALEGSAFVTGAAVQWLRDALGVVQQASETEALARSVPDNAGVYLVPAFVGLGAPHWDMYARGLLIGLTSGTGRAHLARATLESIAYQSRDLVEAMAHAGQPIEQLKVDGGATQNTFLMQFQSDILGIPIEVATVQETTALGAAYLAGLGVGVWRDTTDVARNWQSRARYEPRLSAAERDALYADWLRAVERARGWAVGAA
jgi:glycerol kinase